MSTALPEAGSAEYQAILAETGRSNLDGFDYDAHLAATSGAAATTPTPTPAPVAMPTLAPTGSDPATPATSSNSGAAPTSTPAPTPAAVTLPAVGSAEYEALLLETGRSNLDGFDYAAHLAVKQGVSSSTFDQYLNASTLADLQKLLGSVDANQLFAQSSGEQVQQLVKKFGSDPAFSEFLQNHTTPSAANTAPPTNAGTPVVADTTFHVYEAPSITRNSTVVPLPEFGSVAYKALLLETGRSDLIDFDYGAHLAAKANTSLPNFDQYMNASSGQQLLNMLSATNVNALMAQASPDQVQQLIKHFAADPVFSAYLNTSTTPTLPAAGSPAYESLLAETGRKDLVGFDYQAHLKILTEAKQVIAKVSTETERPATDLVGTASNDKLVYTGLAYAMLAGGDGDDELVAGDHGSMLVPGSGKNVVIGGAALDSVVLDTAITDARIRKGADGVWTLQDANVSSNNNQLQNVERVLFSDVGLALDVATDKPAGETAMILGAVFGKASIDKLDYVGIGLDLFDQGKSFAEISTLAMSVAGVTEPKSVVELLWTNVVGSAPTTEQAQPFVDMLKGGMTAGELAELAAKTDINQTHIDLVGLASKGIEFV